MSVNISRPAITKYESNKYSINKLTTIYRLCAALEVELTDVLQIITVIGDKSSPDVVIIQGEKSSVKFEDDFKQIIDDLKGGS